MKIIFVILLFLPEWFVPINAQLQSDSSDAVWSIVMPLASSTDIDMGQVLVGGGKDSVVTGFIKNMGTWEFNVDSIYFRGADAPAFSLVSGFPKYEIIAGDSHPAEFHFKPIQDKNYKADIVIITQADTLCQTIIGEGAQPQLAVLGDIIDFGNVDVGSFKDTLKAVTIKNISSSDITINNVNFGKPNDIDFSSLTTNNPFKLVSGDTCKMNLRFKPSDVGRTSGVLEFYYNGVGSPARVQLFGTGIFAGLVSAILQTDTIEGFPGDIIEVPVILNDEKNLDISGITNLKADLSFNPTLLYPLDNPKQYIDQSTAKITIDNLPVDKSIGEILTKVRFKVALGNAEGCELVLSNAEAVGGTAVISSINGYFRLLGICREGGTRLFDPYGKVSINAINPNPAKDEMEIKINVIEEGVTKLYIINTLGNKIINIFDGSISKTGEYSFNVPTMDLSSGLYFLILETPTVRKVEKIIVDK